LDPRDDQDLASVDKAPTALGVVVPPKPQTGGMHAVKRYYEENRDAILHDLDTLGEKDMRKRWWNMTQATFYGLMARWRPNYPGIPKWGREKGKTARRAARIEKKEKESAIITTSPIVEVVLNNPSQHLTITDRDIALLVDDDFDRFWSLLGQIVKRRAKLVTR
jgi:hypothetical protein